MRGIRKRVPHGLGTLSAALIGALVLTSCGGSTQAQPASGAPTNAAGAAPAAPRQIKKIVFANATAGASPYQAQIFAGVKLGYYTAEGLELENQALGSNQAVQAALEQGRAEFGVGVPSFQLELASKNPTPPNIVNFYEHTYPFKWDWVVKPDSPITDLSQLKGKKVGVVNLGQSDYQMGQQLLKLVGIDEKSVEWVVVGQGLTGGQALVNGSVDAEINVDTIISLWDSAGIKTRILPRPKGTPYVGGVYLEASKDVLKTQRAAAVGFARVIAKGTVFCNENPRACASFFLELFPENRPAGQNATQQIDTIAQSFARRSKLWVPTDPSAKFGQISEQEWMDEIAFNGYSAKLKDPKVFFTNEIIQEANSFDIEAVKKQAREYKIAN